MKKDLVLRKLIASRVRDLRTNLKLTQTEMGVMIGKDRQFIQRLEKGKHEPSHRIILSLSKITNTPLTYFSDTEQN